MKSLLFISGGQTGVDRAAIDAAILNNINYFGWIPRGRLAEDGVVPYIYDKFKEASSTDYKVRTKLNVDVADGLVAVRYQKPLVGGTLYSLEYAKSISKPYFILDLEINTLENIDAFLKWLIECDISRLNFSGPRISEDANIYTKTFKFLVKFIEYNNESLISH